MAGIRRALPWLTVALGLAVAYDGWIFYSRWQRNRDTERARSEQQAQQAQRTLELLGGGDLHIRNFYVFPPAIESGRQATLCYSVIGAKRVRVEPAIAELHPALNYCFAAMARRTTDYELVAEDDSGHTARARVTLKVLQQGAPSAPR